MLVPCWSHAIPKLRILLTSGCRCGRCNGGDDAPCYELGLQLVDLWNLGAHVPRGEWATEHSATMLECTHVDDGLQDIQRVYLRHLGTQVPRGQRAAEYSRTGYRGLISDT